MRIRPIVVGLVEAAVIVAAVLIVVPIVLALCGETTASGVVGATTGGMIGFVVSRFFRPVRDRLRRWAQRPPPPLCGAADCRASSARRCWRYGHTYCVAHACRCSERIA